MGRAARRYDADLDRYECTKCHRLLKREDFHLNARMLYGINPDCKDCRRTSSREYQRNAVLRDQMAVMEAKYGAPPED